jgi:uncharacterized protein (DUF736 family)
VVLVLVAVTLVAAGCGSPPTISITAPASGTHVGGNVATLHVSATGVTIVSANGDQSGNTAHFAVYVDGTPAAPGSVIASGPAVITTASSQIYVAGLVVGRHVLTAVLADGGERRLGSASATVQVTVDGPSVTAQIVGQVTSSTSFSLQLSSFGVTIANIPTDTSGHTAHYALLIDGALPRPGVIIPPAPNVIITTGSRVPIPTLTRGTHVIWVVLVNGQGRTLSPPAAASVTVSVPK